MSTMHRHEIETGGSSTTEDFDLDDPTLTRFDIVREGARRDGVEIVHYEPRFPVPGTKLEKRVVRSIVFLLVLSGLFAFGSVVAFIWWPFDYEPGQNASKYYTPLVGLGLGGSLLLLGLAVIVWAKKLLPDEISVQDRHPGASPRDEQSLTGATIVNMGEEVGVRRRPVLLGALLLPAAGLAVAPAVYLVGGLLRSPHSPDPVLLNTGWNPEHNDGNKVRLTRDDGTPIRPEDVSVGGQMTAFPGIPHGATNEWADSPVLLIHLRQEDADRLRASISNTPADQKPVEGMWENFVAYSKICTHAGCPASLYEQQTNRLLCPCHQSQFLITDQAKPIFGPATRRLPMLPLELEGEYLVAKSDFLEAVGPAFWERPS